MLDFKALRLMGLITLVPPEVKQNLIRYVPPAADLKAGQFQPSSVQISERSLVM